MNRLIIIGNGFDLAHELETRYEDFLVDYFSKSFEEFNTNGEFSDKLISIRENYKFDKDNYAKESIDLPFKNLSSFLNHNSIFIANDLNIPFVHHSVGKNIRLEFSSNFFQHIIIDKKWSDIEKFYFEYLLNNQNNIDTIQLLNEDFEFLKNKFSEYILEVNSKILKFDREKLNHINFFYNCFEETSPSLFRQKFGNPESSEELKLLCIPKNVYFLNFNYTSLLSKYLGLMPFNNQIHSICQIHGEISDLKSIIFGYGDDSHPEYSNLENKYNDDLLKNIKSFYYPAKPHYNRLIDFVESDVFEVYIIGHSLGLSDRVLLKTIFENENCKSIRLFHRGTTESHFKKCISLSRHFSDKIKMRRKIVDYDANDVLH